jgi:hypothetical protein
MWRDVPADTGDKPAVFRDTIKGTLYNKAQSLPWIPTNSAVDFKKFLKIYGCSVIRKQKSNLKYCHTPISCTQNLKDPQSNFIFLSFLWVQNVMGNSHAQNRDGKDLRHKMGIRTLICPVTQVESNAQWSMGLSHQNQNWNSMTSLEKKYPTWYLMEIHRQCSGYILTDGHNRFNKRSAGVRTRLKT